MRKKITALLLSACMCAGLAGCGTMPILDMTQKDGLLGMLISDLVLTLLSFVSENERTEIRQRQAEGIAAAKSAGMYAVAVGNAHGGDLHYSGLDSVDLLELAVGEEIK